jgi:hypothetical protein
LAVINRTHISWGLHYSETGRTQEGPSNQSGHELTNTPPASHQGQDPAVLARAVFQEYSGVHDEVASSSESRQAHKHAQDNPVGRSTSRDREHCANKEGVAKSPIRSRGDTHGLNDVLERDFATDDVCTKAPEESSSQQADVCRHGHAIAEGGLELECGLAGGDTLEEQEEGVDGITETVQEEELR